MPASAARQDYITESGGKFTVHAESGKPMGTYPTKSEAEKRLREIEYFKHHDSARKDAPEDADVERLQKQLEAQEKKRAGLNRDSQEYADITKHMDRIHREMEKLRNFKSDSFDGIRLDEWSEEARKAAAEARRANSQANKEADAHRGGQTKISREELDKKLKAASTHQLNRALDSGGLDNGVKKAIEQELDRRSQEALERWNQEGNRSSAQRERDRLWMENKKKELLANRRKDATEGEISERIKREYNCGHPEKQAEAIAYSELGEPKGDAATAEIMDALRVVSAGADRLDARLDALEDRQKEWEKKFPVGSWVRENRFGTKPQQVREHRGNMLIVGNNEYLHATKAVMARPDALEARGDAGKKFKPGQRVTFNGGFPGTVVRYYSEGMIEVRGERGLVCIPEEDAKPLSGSATGKKDALEVRGDVRGA